MNNRIFACRFIKHLLCFVFVILPLQVFGAFILLLYLPVHLKLVKAGIKKSIKLPYLLRWYDNADLYVDRNSSTYLAVFGSGYWNLYCWLAWRNPLNYFGYTILGIIVPINLYNSNIGDGIGQEPGFIQTEVVINEKVYYEYYFIKKLDTTHCIRIRIGYKLNGKRKGDIAQWVFVISPYHSYNGI